jgi:hypothetical protein
MHEFAIRGAGCAILQFVVTACDSATRRGAGCAILQFVGPKATYPSSSIPPSPPSFPLTLHRNARLWFKGLSNFFIQPEDLCRSMSSSGR